VRGRIGGGQHHVAARPRELGGDAHGEGRLADAPFAHRHHHALAACGDLLDELIQCLAMRNELRGGFDTCGS
jgi:hypothetical protein